MENSHLLNIFDDEGHNFICRLIGKVNNENGHILYTFHNEHSGKDFTLIREIDGWNCLNGDIPALIFLKHIGVQMESFNI